MNGELQKSGNALTQVMRQRLESQTTLGNIDEAVETLQVAEIQCPKLKLLEMSACAGIVK
jgi:hypothetical protein